MDPALENALLALCSAQVGHHTGKPGMVYESLNLYTTGLKGLREAVMKPSTRHNEQNVAAAVALLMYEMIQCPGRRWDGYKSHLEGAMHLLRLRGPESYRSELAFSVFRVIRTHSVSCICHSLSQPRHIGSKTANPPGKAIQGNMQRSKTFLTEPKWRELPWTGSSRPKDPYDRLLDILLDVPHIFHLDDIMESASSFGEGILGAVELAKECYRLDVRMTDWFNDFVASVAGPLYYPKLSTMTNPADSPDDGKVFPVAFHFPALIVARSLVFYWSSLLAVHGYMQGMDQKLTAYSLSTRKQKQPCTCNAEAKAASDSIICLQHFHMDMLPSLKRGSDWPGMASRNICQSVEYFLQKETRGMGSISILPGLVASRVCWQLDSADWTRETLWVDVILKRIKNDGHEIAGYMPDDTHDGQA
jgi:hypothetical protein